MLIFLDFLVFLCTNYILIILIFTYIYVLFFCFFNRISLYLFIIYLILCFLFYSDLLIILYIIIQYEIIYTVKDVENIFFYVLHTFNLIFLPCLI